MNNKTAIIIFIIVTIPIGVVIYFMKGPSAKSDALGWFAIVAGVFLAAVIITVIRKKRGSQ